MPKSTHSRFRALRAAALIVTVTAAGPLVPAGAAFSQSGGNGYVRSWENHVNASLIRGIVQRDGDLYMATNGGILIFDPDSDEFEQYQKTDGLPSQSVTCLMFYGDGDLLVGTQDVGIVDLTLGPGGVDVHEVYNFLLTDLHVTSVGIWGGEIVYGTVNGGGWFENGLPGPVIDVPRGLPDNWVYDVFVDGEFVWFATKGGLAVVGLNTPVKQFPTGPPSSYVVEKSDDAIWVGSGNGVWRMALSDSSWTQTGPAYKIYSLFWDGQTMWAGGTKAFYEYDSVGQQWVEYEIRSFYGPYAMPVGTADLAGEILAITRVPGGDVYLGATSSGYPYGTNLIRYDGALENLRSNYPGENRLERLSYDVDGSLWVGSNGFGVGKLTPSGRWVNYNTSVPEAGRLSSLFTNVAFLADSDGIKWFSTMTVNDADPMPLDELDDKLDDDYANDEWTRHTLYSGGYDTYSTLRPQRAVEDPAGNRWFLADDKGETYKLTNGANMHGIYILSQDKTEWLRVQPQTTDMEMRGRDITHVAFRHDLAFVASRNYGVESWYTGSETNHYDWAELKDLSDDIWGGEFRARFGVRGELFEAEEVTSLALRSDGVLWIGTDAGLYKYDPSSYSFRRFLVKRGREIGILAPKVNWVVLDHYENLWLSTDMGLNRIARDDDNDISAYTTAGAYKKLADAGKDYGPEVITPLAFEACTELLLRPERDVLYVATYGGLSILDITPPPPQTTDLTKIYVYPNPVYGNKHQDVLWIDNVDAPVRVEIYDLEGNLVHSQTASGSQEVVWDLTTRSGFIVASGTYLVRVDNGYDAVVLPVVVIR